MSGISRGEAIPLSNETAEELTLAIRTLTDEVRVLRQAVDEIGDELGWANRNRDLDQLTPPPFHLTSFPLDPLAEDFAERVNAVSRDDLPPEVFERGATKPVEKRKQSKLW